MSENWTYDTVSGMSSTFLNRPDHIKNFLSQSEGMCPGTLKEEPRSSMEEKSQQCESGTPTQKTTVTLWSIASHLINSWITVFDLDITVCMLHKVWLINTSEQCFSTSGNCTTAGNHRTPWPLAAWQQDQQCMLKKDFLSILSLLLVFFVHLPIQK